MKCKLPSVSFPFLVHVNLCLHTFTDVTVTSRGVSGGGLLKKIIAAEKCIFVSEQFMEILGKKY